MSETQNPSEIVQVQFDKGADLLAFAESQRNQTSIILPPPEQPYPDEAIKILREALDEQELAQAWQAV